MKSLNIRTFIHFLMMVCVVAASNVEAQPMALMEACNEIQTANKRLECFKEIFRNQSASINIPGARLRSVVASFDSAMSSSISFDQFKTLRLELAKELGIYRADSSASPHVVELMTAVLLAYSDAEKFWLINIREGGSKGLLTPSDMVDLGMKGYIEKYQIHLVELNWNKWVSRSNGLRAIWDFAKNKTDQALERL